MFKDLSFVMVDDVSVYTINDTEFGSATLEVPATYLKGDKFFNYEKETEFVKDFIRKFIALYESKSMNVAENLVLFHNNILMFSGYSEDLDAFDDVFYELSQEMQNNILMVLMNSMPEKAGKFSVN